WHGPKCQPFGMGQSANHLAWAKVPTIWHGPKCQPFGMGQNALPFGMGQNALPFAIKRKGGN
ncbi:MAG: hypothetical protein QGI42_01235, partial [Rhodospirillales bacterium]|nr:hypothetical protein [Rhodospirillales bacterium]